MAPGTYLEKRRLMAGYSLSSLARELLMVTGFGQSRAESDFRRLRLTLISAEQGSIPHKRERIELIRAFVPLDVSLYLHLVDCERSGDPYRVEGICRLCACSFLDPCVLHVGPTAQLGEATCHWSEPALCSACAGFEAFCAAQAAVPLRGPVPERRPVPSIAEQLREVSERMSRIATREDARANTAGQPPFLRVVANDRPLPLTEALLRPIPLGER